MLILSVYFLIITEKYLLYFRYFSDYFGVLINLLPSARMLISLKGKEKPFLDNK